eukprot:6678459-Pyramimonas_sp.AAC.1
MQPTADAVAGWRARLRSVLVRLARHRQRQNGAEQVPQLADVCRVFVSDVPKGTHSVISGGHGAPRWSQWVD